MGFFNSNESTGLFASKQAYYTSVPVPNLEHAEAPTQRLRRPCIVAVVGVAVVSALLAFTAEHVPSLGLYRLGGQAKEDTRSDVQKALDEQLEAQLDAQLDAQIEAQLQLQLDDQLDAMLQKQLEDALDAELEREMDEEIGRQLGDQLGDEFGEQADAQLDEQVADYDVSDPRDMQMALDPEEAKGLARRAKTWAKQTMKPFVASAKLTGKAALDDSS
jgi:hypothetical protein